MTFSRTRRFAVVFAGFGVIAATLTTTLALADASGPVSASESTKWSTNASGLTYGSAAKALSLDDEPDLIAVVATNGKAGYSRRVDLEGALTTSPRQAISNQQTQSNKSELVPVYLSDGKTQIGVFAIDYPEPTLNSASPPN